MPVWPTSTPMVSLAIIIMVSISANQLSTANVDNRRENEKRLVYDLFERNGYNPLIRPVVDVTDSLQINFSLALSQIISVDEKNQVMKTNVWLQIFWFDYQLKWNPPDYDGITSLRIRPDSVWVPDIVLFNNADGNYEVTYKSNCVIRNDGSVSWIPPAIYKSSCAIDVQYFPFDEQECDMKFGSWTFRGRALTYVFQYGMDKVDLTDYLKSGTWDLIDCPGKIIYNKDEYGEDKGIIVFRFVLRRKTLFYTVNLIIPCVLISFVSVCVFALPADAGEKITLCISVLLALVVFMLLVSKILPPSLTIPLIAKYLLFTFIMNIVAILATVITINRNYRTPRTHSMPYWVRLIFLKHLPRFLLMRRPDHDDRWQSKTTTTATSSLSSPDMRRANLTLRTPDDLLELTEVHQPHCRLNPSNIGSPSMYNYPASGASFRDLSCGPPTEANHEGLTERRRHRTPTSATNARQALRRIQESSIAESRTSKFSISPELYGATDSVQFIYQHLKSEEDYAAVLDDWKYMARVLDRLLLYVFLTVTIVGSMGILLNAPHILEYVNQDQIIDELLKYIEAKRNA